MPAPIKYLTTGEVAAAVGVGAETVIAWIKAGNLTAIQPGGPRGEYRVPEDEVARLMTPVRPNNSAVAS